MATLAGRPPWPCRRAGHDVTAVDNFASGRESEIGVRPLFPIPTLHERIRAWREVTGLEIGLAVGDLTDYGFVEAIVRDRDPTPSSTTANSRPRRTR